MDLVNLKDMLKCVTPPPPTILKIYYVNNLTNPHPLEELHRALMF